jgi:uncharacterized protein YkwD
MKNTFLAQKPSGFIPRLKSLSLSDILPNLYVLAVLLLLALTAHIASAQSIATNFRPSYEPGARSREVATLASLERRVFDLVNQERVRAGKPALVWLDRVATVARYHSTNMSTNNFFSHVDPQGRRSGKRADQLGVSDWKQIGENIAWLSGSDPAARVVRSWMQSPGHRDNIMNGAYRESGIGLSIAADGKYYFTQVFVRRR